MPEIEVEALAGAEAQGEGKVPTRARLPLLEAQGEG